MSYENILVETRGRVGLVTLNRPKALNALNDKLMDELGEALIAFDGDEAIGAMVVTGSEKAFAAGADIGAMSDVDVHGRVQGRVHQPQLGDDQARAQAGHRRGERGTRWAAAASWR